MSESPKNKLNLFSATNLVIANIIGAGIFTISGYTLGSVPSVFGLLLIWFIGGILALCGALVYGELCSIMPKSGGEYYYLSRIYHPILGFLSGFISLFAGFAAPVAAASVGVAIPVYITPTTANTMNPTGRIYFVKAEIFKTKLIDSTE